MNKLIAIVTVISTFVCIADVPKVNLSKMTLEERQQFIQKRLGGYIAKPNTAQGHIVIVNAQTKTKIETIKKAIGDVNDKLHYKLIFVEGAFSFPNPKIQGEATLFIVNDDAMPTILSAPEDRWAMVNLAKLASGIGAKEKFFEARALKEITRGFCILCGAQDSNYKALLQS